MSAGNLRATNHLRELDAFPHGSQIFLALAKGTRSQRFHAKITLRPSSALSNGIAEPGCDVALGLQTIQRAVKRANSQRSLGAFLDLAAHWNAIRIFVK